VTAWHQREEESAALLATRRRARDAAAERERTLRAKDVGAIKQWLVLAPIPVVGSDVPAMVKALRQEQIANEGRIQPRTGESVRLGQIDRVWRTVHLQDYLLNLNELLEQQTDFAVAYAVCYVRSEKAHAGVSMRVGCDDAARVYLNGTEVYRSETIRPWVPDHDEVKGLQLNAGINVLVFKIVNGPENWRGSVRLADAAGSPLTGIELTLNPE
jgi:hypothetical protein